MPKPIEKVKIPWHPGFYGAAEIEFSANKAELEFHREYNLSKEPLIMDLLIIKKLSDTRIKNEIGWIFKKYNVVEYKSPEDSLNIDDFYKTIGYACLYKGLGTSVNQIPAEELTVSIFRESFPRELFKLLERSGFCVEARRPGIYYISGPIPFDTQVVVTGGLESETHLSLRMLSSRVREKEARAFLEEIRSVTQPGDRNNIDAVLQVSLQANPKLYEAIRRNFHMSDFLREFFKEDIEAELNRQLAEIIKSNEEAKKAEEEAKKAEEEAKKAEEEAKKAEEEAKKAEEEAKKAEKEAKRAEEKARKDAEEKTLTILTSISSLMDSMKWTAEQAMSAMKIPDTDRAEYMARL